MFLISDILPDILPDTLPDILPDILPDMLPDKFDIVILTHRIKTRGVISSQSWTSNVFIYTFVFV